MSWLFFAFINVVMASVASLYQKVAMREEKTDAVVSAITFMLLSDACYFVYALVTGLHLPPISIVPYFLGASILYAAGTVLFFRAIKKIEASEMSIIGSAGSIVTLIASMIFLKDVFATSQFIGIVCILGAVVLINFKKHDFVINQGTWLALLATSCYGIAVIFDTVIIHNFEVASYMAIGTAGTALVMMFMYPRKVPTVFKSLRQVNTALLIFSVLYAIQGIAFYLALNTGVLVAQLSAVARASIILTVILSTIFLGERDNMLKKLFGAVLTTVGVILVSQ